GGRLRGGGGGPGAGRPAAGPGARPAARADGRGRRPRRRGDRPRARLTDSSPAAPPPIMAPVHAPRLVLLLVPAMTAVVIAHAYDGEGKWEGLVSVLAVLAATLAILLARRDASTALARIPAATGPGP